MDKLEQARSYARRLALIDSAAGFMRADFGVIWSAENIVRKTFAYSDQNSVVRAYYEAWEAAQ